MMRVPFLSTFQGRLPTDLQILDEIYHRYYQIFCSFDHSEPDRSSKIYVPIDIQALADHFQVDGDIVFGRLYYHLNQKYGYTRSDGSNVHLFTLKAGEDKHAVNFPYLASITAELRQSRDRVWIANTLSAAAVVIALLSWAS